MTTIRIVVCPVDFSPATTRQVDLAADVCRAFGARLVLHHNVTDLSVGAGVGWMWHADQPTSDPSPVDDRLRDLLRRVPKETEVETCVTRGAVTEAVRTVSDAAEADVIVLSAHAGKTEDHASVIEDLLEHSSRAVLALHDPGADLAVPKFVLDGERSAMQTLLVPTNLSTEPHPQVDLAFDLARMFPLRLHLLHVHETPLGPEPPNEDHGDLRARLMALVPSDLTARTVVHVRSGETVQVIVETAKQLRASCIVMGEHTRAPVKRWFTHDTARAVLHEASCPVWYVPPVKRNVGSLSRFALSDEKSSLWGNV